MSMTIEKPELRVDCKINGKLCGACCYKAVVPLTREDIKKIENLGFKAREFIEFRLGVPILRNIDGHCMFLDTATNTCKIYEMRPEACRLYPLIYSPKLWVHVDPRCPKAKDVPKEEVVKLASHVLRFYEKIKAEWLSENARDYSQDA